MESSSREFRVNEPVGEVLECISKELSRCEGVVGAVLLGSSSRGEETYEYQEETKSNRLLSDVEVAVVVDDVNCRSALELTIASAFEVVEEKMLSKHSALFHIDYSIYRKKQLLRLDRRFIHFETKSTGVQFFGSTNVVELYPLINLSNINWTELKTVLLHRHYKVLKSLCHCSPEIWVYLISRNLLDVMTVLLPYEGELVAGYSNRLEVLKGHSFSEVANRHFDHSQLCARLEKALEIKKYPQTNVESWSWMQALSIYLEEMDNLYSYLQELLCENIFTYDRRGILRSIFMLDAKALFFEFKRGGMTKRLYEEVNSELKKITATGDVVVSMSSYSDQMMLLYRYR